MSADETKTALLVVQIECLCKSEKHPIKLEAICDDDITSTTPDPSNQIVKKENYLDQAPTPHTMFEDIVKSEHSLDTHSQCSGVKFEIENIATITEFSSTPLLLLDNQDECLCKSEKHPMELEAICDDDITSTTPDPSNQIVKKENDLDPAPTPHTMFEDIVKSEHSPDTHSQCSDVKFEIENTAIAIVTTTEISSTPLLTPDNQDEEASNLFGDDKSIITNGGKTVPPSGSGSGVMAISVESGEDSNVADGCEETGKDDDCDEDIEQCDEDIEQCDEDLEQCVDDIEQCDEDIEQCGKDIEQCGKDIEHCGKDIKQRDEDIEQCDEDIEHCGKDIEQCDENIEQCDEDIEQCVEVIEQCGKDIEQCGKDIEQCVEDIEQCVEQETSATITKNKSKTVSGKSSLTQPPTQKMKTKQRDDRPHRCTTCGKSFRYNADLAVHTRIHTGEKPYQCSFCGKTFTQNSHVKNHLRTHTGQKPYKCTHCGRGFSISSTMHMHVRTHTGEKPFKCDQCGKGFSGQSAVKRHLRTHNREKPYQCKHCEMAFADSSTLCGHVKAHTGKQNRYKCAVCGKEYSQKKYLRSHMKRNVECNDETSKTSAAMEV